MENIRVQVRSLVERMASAQRAPRGPVASSERLIDDLGYDSLRLIDLAHSLESEFAMPPVNEREMMSVITVGDLEDLVVGRLAVRGRP